MGICFHSLFQFAFFDMAELVLEECKLQSVSLKCSFLFCASCGTPLYPLVNILCNAMNLNLA